MTIRHLRIFQTVCTPVSYTHLDVYKRQRISRLSNTAFSSVEEAWSADIRKPTFPISGKRLSLRSSTLIVHVDPLLDSRCEGVYRFRVISFELLERKRVGKRWEKVIFYLTFFGRYAILILVLIG